MRIWRQTKTSQHGIVVLLFFFFCQLRLYRRLFSYHRHLDTDNRFQCWKGFHLRWNSHRHHLFGLASFAFEWWLLAFFLLFLRTILCDLCSSWNFFRTPFYQCHSLLHSFSPPCEELYFFSSHFFSFCPSQYSSLRYRDPHALRPPIKFIVLRVAFEHHLIFFSLFPT